MGVPFAFTRCIELNKYSNSDDSSIGEGFGIVTKPEV